MQEEELEKEKLLEQQKRRLTDNTKFREPAPLRAPPRPYKGIFLAFFLWATGLLFFVHGFHRYEDYSLWDLLAVWLLSFLRSCLMI